MSLEDHGRGSGTEQAQATLEHLRSAPAEVPPEDVEKSIRVLPSHYRDREVGVEMPGVRGAADWHGYEMRIWELSEAFREYLKRKRTLRGRCGVLDAVADVIKEPRFGKGRQNFVLILAQYGGSSYASAIAWALDDPEIMGHAVKALAKLQEPGYSERIQGILEHSQVGWIRSAARKYLRGVASLG